MNKIVNIGRIKQHGKSAQLCIDNPNPIKNGKVNPYAKGILIWYDYDTSSYHQIKNMTISDIKEPKNNFNNNVWIKLDDKFYAQELNE